MKRFVIGSVLCTLAGLTHVVALAQTSTAASVGKSAAEIEAYWTPQRLLSAKSLDLHPVAGSSGYPKGPQPGTDKSPGSRSDGAAPTVKLSAYEAKTLIPESYLEPALPGIAPLLTSSAGAYFTTYRAFPDAAVTAYPNSAAGKLFFTDPATGYNYVCSASTLRPRIVATAGHCVSEPNTNAALRHLYTNFLFVPAYNNGNAPFGSWTANTVRVADAWYTSNGSVPNAQDVALLVMNDNNGRKIGSVTGYLGYMTNQLAKNHVTMLGYPVNLDNGQRMQINHAQTYQSGGNNTYIYGNAMRGGSSGGPWIMNYGISPSSNPGISGMGTNYLIAVTSYGPVASEPKYQGASNLDSRFVALLTAACGAPSSGNCQ